MLEAEGHHVDALRVRAFPFAPERRATSSPTTTASSSSSRTATRSCAPCWSTRTRSTPRKLVPVLHYDGTPITARFIATAIATKLGQFKVVSFDKAAS